MPEGVGWFATWKLQADSQPLEHIPTQMTGPKPRCLCFGAGAIGTYLGGSLALAGLDVVFLEQPAVARELQDRGLRLDLRADKGRDSAQPLLLPAGVATFAESPEQALALGPFDAAIFALKSFDTDSALDAIRPWAGDMPPIVCFSNGVENEAKISAVVGTEKVVAATVTSAIGRRATGDIILEKLRGIGLHISRPISERLLEAANDAGLRARGFRDAAAMKWSKMFTNLIANPTSAILNMTASEVLADPGMYRLEIGMLRECLAVMKAKGIPVVDLPGTPVRALATAVGWPPWLSKPVLARAAGGRARPEDAFIPHRSAFGSGEIRSGLPAWCRCARRQGHRCSHSHQCVSHPNACGSHRGTASRGPIRPQAR